MCLPLEIPVRGLKTVSIRRVVDEPTLVQVCRLRYEVYVEEMKKPYAQADHEARVLREPADDHSVVLAAFSGDRLVGTGRCALASWPGVPGSVATDLGVDAWARLVGRNRIFVTSRLMVALAFRGGSRVPSALVEAMYIVAREVGAAVGLCATRGSLIRFFERYGFRRYGDPFFDRQSGLQQASMALMCEDVEHLERIRSPFRRYAGNYTNQPPEGSWLNLLQP
jgi:predicted GNAT family N-acyltransferase